MRRALLVAIIAALVSGCFIYTTKTWRMRSMINEYFDPEKGIYPSLDDKIFDTRTRFTGIMDSRHFAEEFGFWIFLTEPHDPARIPVVLVHGHWTGPPAFKRLAASLDRKHFEPWFTYYPTGEDLQEIAIQFRQNLERLCAYYHQQTVVIIGFSMCGLVARQALRPMEDNVTMPRVPLLIGISNPWGGSMKVRTGTRFTFAAKSWHQFVDGSEFITHLFDDPLPAETAFHMIYGLGGDDEFLPGPDDGMLSEQTMRRPEAVAQAASVMIVPEATHTSIISDARAICKVNELLADLGTGAAEDRGPTVRVGQQP